MKKNAFRHILFGILLIVVFWFIDSFVDARFNYPYDSFFDILLLDIPQKELVMRIIIVLIALVVGLVYYIMLHRLAKSEWELNDAREKYMLLARNTNDVIWTMDMNGRFTFVSPSVERLRGYTPEEVMEGTLEDALTPKSQKVVKDLMVRLSEYLQSNPGRIPSILTELEQPCKDGSSVWTEASVSIIFDDNKNPDLLVGVSRNIDDRKATENEVLRSEQNYRQLADNSHDYIITHNLDGFINYMNPSALKSLGYNPDEVVGMRFSDLVPEEYHRLINNIVQLRKDDEKSKILYELEFLTGEGKRIPVEINSSSLFLNGQLVSVLITARDIRARLEARKLFRKNELRYRLYIEHSPIPILSIDREGNINYLNPVGGEYFGYPVRELEKMNISTLINDRYRERCMDLLKNTSRHSFTIETVFLNSQGDQLTAIVSGGRTEENDMLLYIVDITNRKKAEERAVNSENKLRELNANLEHLILQRTNELSIANKELESFSYSISHDLRAPLRHIEAFSGLLSSNIEASDLVKARQNLERIVRSVDNMRNLINHLLEFSKLGRAALSESIFSMDDLLSEVIEELGPSYLNGSEIIREKMGRVHADRQLVKLVWQNLVSNAIKFSSKEKEPVIKIGKMEGNGHPSYYIKDNGVGFDPEFSDKLFGVFQRLHSESEFDGIGIGLPVVKRIIEKHGGKIKAESKPGEGASFVFSLPAGLK